MPLPNSIITVIVTGILLVGGAATGAAQPAGPDVDVSYEGETITLTMTTGDESVVGLTVEITAVDGSYAGEGSYTTDENGTLTAPAPERTMDLEFSTSYEGMDLSRTLTVEGTNADGSDAADIDLERGSDEINTDIPDHIQEFIDNLERGVENEDDEQTITVVTFEIGDSEDGAPEDLENVTTVEEFDGEPPEDWDGAPPEDFEGELPENFTEEPPEDWEGEPPEVFDEEPPEDWEEEPPKNFTEEPPEDWEGEPPEDWEGEPPEDFEGEPPENFTGEPPEDWEGEPPEVFDEEPPEDWDGETPEEFEGEPPEDFDEEPPDDFESEPTEDFDEEPLENATDEPPEEFEDDDGDE